MTTPVGPGTPFVVLFDESVDEGVPLPDAFADIYGGVWPLPPPCERPYVYVNFVLSRDGRVSFNVPGQATGAYVAGFDGHDRWLMALLRARADAILVGDNTLRVEPDHVWTAQHLCPADAEAFAALRRAEGRGVLPLQVFLSLDGDVDVSTARIFAEADAHIVLATTVRGAARARSLPSFMARLDVLELGRDNVDIRSLLEVLRTDYGVGALLCEGGPRAYGSLVAASCVDDEFLTLSPVVAGSSPGSPRPGLIEGVVFAADVHPWSRPLSLRRAGDLLFLRSRFTFP